MTHIDLLAAFIQVYGVLVLVGSMVWMLVDELRESTAFQQSAG
jgi:hypothetical protein